LGDFAFNVEISGWKNPDDSTAGCKERHQNKETALIFIFSIVKVQIYKAMRNGETLNNSIIEQIFYYVKKREITPGSRRSIPEEH